MNLTRNKIFFGILIFGIIVNLLIHFNIQYFYLRAIFSFIFLITIPGLLIMLMLKIRKIDFWEYLVYLIGLSVAFVMFAGLAVNWTDIIIHPNEWGKDLSNGISSLNSSCDIEEKELPIPVQSIWIGSDNVLYGYYNGKIVKSTDDGRTWITIYKFTEGEGSRQVWIDSRGTIFTGNDNTGKMYMSKDNDNNWVVSLKFVCQNATLANGKSEGFGTLWKMDEDSLGNLYVGEYGGEWDANCAYIHKSTDGGLTWKIAYDSLAYGWNGRHIHIVKVDKKNDYIYAAQGDGYDRARLIRSTDYGKTWTTLQSGTLDAQYTSMIFYPDFRLFGTDTDNPPNKIIKTSDDITFSSVLELSGQFAWSSNKDFNGVAFIGTVSGNAGNHISLYETRDKGDSWCKVRDLGVTTSEFQGIDSISNFSSEGYAYYHENLNNKTYRFKDTSKPTKQTFPFLENISKPLSLNRILISFDVILLILTLIAYKRNPDLEFKPELPKLNTLNRIFFIIPLIFPTLSILGAIILNNNGPNLLTMIMLGEIAIYVFFIVLFRNKLNEHIFPWAILMISISLLLMGWLRSWYVSGADINLEYYIFQLVKSNQEWNMSLFNNAYNACLSVTLLPTILSLFIKINDQYIFKLIIPLIFSITPVCIYLLLRRYTQCVFAFIAAFFFMSQPVFMSWWWIPVRQEIAFLFFALALLILFSKAIGSIQKNILLLIFLFSMVVSHYSTTYITFALLIFTYIICLVFRKTEKIGFFSKVYGKLSLKEKNNVYIKKEYFMKGIIVGFVLIFAFLWYSQLTGISNNLVDFTKKTIQNMGKIFSEDIRTEGASFGFQWNIFYKQKDKTYSLQNYINELTTVYKKILYIKSYPQAEYERYKSEVRDSNPFPLKIDSGISSKIYLFREIVKKLVKLFIVFNVFYLIFTQLKKRNIDTEYIIMILGSLFGMVAAMVLPYVSIEYDLTRQYQQLLVILSLPAVLGGLVIFNFFRRESLKTFAVLTVFILYFLFLSEFVSQIVGGTDLSLQLNNSGSGYDELYVHESEIKSSAWLFKNRVNDELVYADQRALYKLWFSNNIDVNKIIENVFPPLIDKNAYVFSSDTNTLKKRAFVSIKGELISYNFPTEFLNQNKNLIYSSGKSEIFK